MISIRGRFAVGNANDFELGYPMYDMWVLCHWSSTQLTSYLCPSLHVTQKIQAHNVRIRWRPYIYLRYILIKVIFPCGIFITTDDITLKFEAHKLPVYTSRGIHELKFLKVSCHCINHALNGTGQEYIFDQMRIGIDWSEFIPYKEKSVWSQSLCHFAILSACIINISLNLDLWIISLINIHIYWKIWPFVSQILHYITDPCMIQRDLWISMKLSFRQKWLIIQHASECTYKSQGQSQHSITRKSIFW